MVTLLNRPMVIQISKKGILVRFPYKELPYFNTMIFRLNIEKTITHALKQENRNPNQIAIKLQKHFISHYNMNIKLYAYIQA